jgi:hypothetical protein
MKSPSLERIHAKLDKQIKLVRSYTEIEGMDFIIRACRLKPRDYVFEAVDKKIVLHKWWFDEFGNSLIIDKKISLIHNDLRLDRKKIVCTDLYYGLTLNRVAKMSKLVHLVVGKDEDLLQECCLLTFLGLDDHLRSYLCWYGEWQQVSPLIMGMKSLILLADHLDIKYFQQIGKKENSAIPCVAGETWLSYLPPSADFLETIKSKQEIIYSLLDNHENTKDGERR